MHGFPDPEVERNLHAGLLVVESPGNIDFDGDAFRVCLYLPDADDAIGTPKKAEELLGETGVTQPHVHVSHSLRRTPNAQVRTFRVRPHG